MKVVMKKSFGLDAVQWFPSSNLKDVSEDVYVNSAGLPESRGTGVITDADGNPIHIKSGDWLIFKDGILGEVLPDAEFNEWYEVVP